MAQESVKPDAVNFVTVDETGEGMRLDNFLARALKGVPKSHIQKIVRDGSVRVNKKRRSGSDRLELGDVVRIPPVRVAARPDKLPPPPLAFRVAYEDDWILAVDKPSGIASHGGSGVSWGAIEAMRAARPDLRYLELAHRLDKATSGLLVMCKKRSALRALHEQFRDKHPVKKYLALSSGIWNRRRGAIDAPLKDCRDKAGQKYARPDLRGAPSRTLFEPIKNLCGPNGAKGTLLVATPLTGRTHQIRAHMRFAGCPVAGDDKYGFDEDNRVWAKAGLPRLFLHAQSIEIDHPRTGARLLIEVPLQRDLRSFLESLSEIRPEGPMSR